MEIPKPFRDQRPWGEELWLTSTSPSMVKIITVKPGESLSLQYHHKRDEFWHIISGDGSIEIDTAVVLAAPDDDFFIPRGSKHRVTGGSLPLTFIELAFGEFDENDIVRLEDRYGRK